MLASVWGIGHHARFGRSALGGFAPAHYLKQFHPKYVSKEDLAKKVAELNFDGWVTMFKNRNDACRNVDLPVVTPWKTTSPLTTPTWVLERNPYSVWVDTDGNQLPYIDRIRMTLGENLEVINLRAIAGEYDSQARHIDISKLPVLLENQQKGGYRVYLDPSDQGADVGLFCNQTYEKDAEIAKWLAHPRVPDRPVPRHRPRADQRDVPARPRPDRLRRAGGADALLPRSGVQDPAHGLRRQEGQRNARQARARQEGQRGVSPARRRQEAGCVSPSPPTSGFLPFTSIAEMIARAVEEDRHTR